MRSPTVSICCFIPEVVQLLGKVIEGLIICHFYNLQLPRVCLSWQTAQTLMRRRVLRRLIWVYAVCIYSLFKCIQPVTHVRTLNFRLATPPENGFLFNSFLARGGFCRLLVTFENSLDPYQDRQNVRFDLDPKRLTLIVFLEELF